MSDPILSKPYNSPDEAAVAGFKRVLMNNVEWETKEFAFWVIQKVDAQHQIKYHYTTPVSDGSKHSVKLAAPTGLTPPHAFCHTHPKSLSDMGFSADDVDQFKKWNEPNNYYRMAFYMMDPNKHLHRAKIDQNPEPDPRKWDEYILKLFGKGRLGTPLDWLNVEP